MKVSHQIAISASRAAVWRTLTDPALQSRWRDAAVVGTLAGDRGRDDSVGAHWFVLPPGGRQVIEVVAESVAGSRLVVHRTESMLFRDWVLEIELSGDDNSTEVHWNEQRESWLPGKLHPRRVWSRRIERELAAMAEVAQQGPTPPCLAPLPKPDFARDHAEMDELLARAESCRVVQQTLADELTHDDDPLQYFARVYALLTRGRSHGRTRGACTTAAGRSG